MSKRGFSSFIGVAASIMLAACGTNDVKIETGAAGDMQRGEEFAAVPQALVVQKAGDAAAVTDDDAFYLAIKKSALQKQWFLAAYLTQQFPVDANNIPFYSLDTKVVSFKVQNGKVYVFDVDHSRKWSDQVNPEVIVDAYPLIDGSLFKNLPNASDYVFIDPTGGMNKFTAYSDSQSYANSTFKVELMYAKRFNRYTDGMSFDQVFTGYSNLQGAGPENLFRASGTLTISLRAYAEGQGFVPTPATDAAEGPYYFTSKPSLVPNDGTYTASSIHWNVYRGMKPIKWVISRNILNIAQSPDFQGYDVVGALKKAITQWNDVYGFTVLTADIASTTDTPGDEDKNFVVIDDNASAGYAFANFRENPNNGEIRAASIYFSSVWFGAALSVGDALSQPVAAPAVPSKNELAAMTTEQMNSLLARKASKAKAASGIKLGWAALNRQSTCELDAASTVAAIRLSQAVRQLKGQAPSAAALSKKDIVERFLTHVLTHEIGHTLGLRHNFKGSLKGHTSSSVMDYLTDADSVDSYQPGSYDKAALAFLHGTATAEPTDKFCTDEYVSLHAECNVFDTGVDPWTESVKPAYRSIVFDQDIFGFLFGLDAETHAFARGGGTTAVRNDAFDTLMIPAGPIDPALLARDPFFGTWFDILSNFALGASYLQTPAQLGANGIRITTPLSSSYNTKTIGFCSGILANSDKIRSIGSRSTCISVLDKIHTTPALVALTQARTALSLPANQPPATATDADKAQFAALQAKLARVIDAWLK